MAVLLEIRPGASQEEKLIYLRDQIEMYLNSLESINRDEIDALIEAVVTAGGSSNPSGGGGGGSHSIASYLELLDKPSIEGVMLQGNQTFEQLNLSRLSNADIEEMLENSEMNIT